MKKNIYKALGIGIPVLIIILAIIFSQPKNIEQLILDYDSITLNDIGDMRTLNFSYSPDNAKIPDIAYVSDDTDIAKFEDNRLIGVSEGTTRVHIREKGSDIVSNEVEVTVKDKTAELKRQAAPIITAIAAIGEVSLDSESAIINANALYDNAPDEVRAYVTNKSVLTTSTEQLNAMKAQPAPQEQIIETSTPTDSELSVTPTQEEDTAEYNSTGTVYRGKTGTKYHRKSCHTLKGNGIAITMQEALEQGREACKVCKP